MTTTIILLIVTFILNLIDYWQTIYGTHLFGIGIELNPIGRFLLTHNYVWVGKLIAVPLALIGLGLIIKSERKHIWAAYLLVIWFLIIVINNFIVLYQLGVI